MQQIQPLCTQHAEEKNHASDVAIWPVEVGYEALPDRIAPDREDNRNRRGYGLGRECPVRVCDNYGHSPVDQINR